MNIGAKVVTKYVVMVEFEEHEVYGLRNMAEDLEANHGSTTRLGYSTRLLSSLAAAAMRELERVKTGCDGSDTVRATISP